MGKDCTPEKRAIICDMNKKKRKAPAEIAEIRLCSRKVVYNALISDSSCVWTIRCQENPDRVKQ